jgi:hypothetical protein
MIGTNSIFTGLIYKTSLYKNVLFIFPTTDLSENTKEYCKIYPVLLPVSMAVKYKFCVFWWNIQQCNGLRIHVTGELNWHLFTPGKWDQKTTQKLTFTHACSSEKDTVSMNDSIFYILIQIMPKCLPLWKAWMKMYQERLGMLNRISKLQSKRV